MLKLTHNGKILFVFSDPGGAKPCLALMTECAAGDVMAVSDRKYDFYKDFNADVKLYDKNYDSIIQSFKPDLIFTGTSYTSTIEKEFIAIAKTYSIPCWSFVDHWTSISNRFRNDQQLLNLPDLIWVMDERAKNIAVQEGIAGDKIAVSGNPYHRWLNNWHPHTTRRQFLKEAGVDDQQRKIIVFAPDPLSNVDGKSAYGFDELSASKTLVDILDNNSQQIDDWLLLIKPHPNQNITELETIFSGQKKCKILPSDIGANEIIYFADVVVGFFSSFLIEADIMSKPVVRFLESCSYNDPFAEIEVGTVADEWKLISEISNVLKNG
jgi:hypothetical protein